MNNSPVSVPTHIILFSSFIIEAQSKYNSSVPSGKCFPNHPSSSFTLNDILKLNKIIKPKKIILTNLTSEIDYSDLKKRLPKNIIPAYDGLSFLI